MGYCGPNFGGFSAFVKRQPSVSSQHFMNTQQFHQICFMADKVLITIIIIKVNNTMYTILTYIRKHKLYKLRK